MLQLGAEIMRGVERKTIFSQVTVRSSSRTLVLFIGCIALLAHSVNATTTTFAPTQLPTSRPSSRPTAGPTATFKPTPLPTSRPSSEPSGMPSDGPSSQPSSQPTGFPSNQPTTNPSAPSGQPTTSPTESPAPTGQPTAQPTLEPTYSQRPTKCPTAQPSVLPSVYPSSQPSGAPTVQPSAQPSIPTGQPSTLPSGSPSTQPTDTPSGNPTIKPTQPTSCPTSQPSREPTSQPSSIPSRQPTSVPSARPSSHPTVSPTRTFRPTSQPSMQPSGGPTSQPTYRPTAGPSISFTPTKTPSAKPSGGPTMQPSTQPTSFPSAQPTFRPSAPSSQPSSVPSRQPSSQPASYPTMQPSSQPSVGPSSQPTSIPSAPSSQPTNVPSRQPTSQPTVKPTVTFTPTKVPTSRPSSYPSLRPLAAPTSAPTRTYYPSSTPTIRPTSRPTAHPSILGGPTPLPTFFYESIDVVGTVQFYPDSGVACTPVQLILNFTTNTTLAAGATLEFSLPGITNGECTWATNGFLNEEVIVPNMEVSSLVESAVYTEGSYIDDYAASSIAISTLEEIRFGQQVSFVIDRANKLRRSCTTSLDQWAMSVTPFGLTGGQVGHLRPIIETQRRSCFLFFSELAFSQAHPQFYVGIRLTLHLGFSVAEDPTVTIYLPGFTRRFAGYRLNILQADLTDSEFDFEFSEGTQSADNSPLVISHYHNFTWTGVWREGDASDGFADSRIVLTASDYQELNQQFWIDIDRLENRIVPIYGKEANDSSLQIEVTSSVLDIARTPIINSNPVGPGCDAKKRCSGHGTCDFAKGLCNCFDGYGSEGDRNATEEDSFSVDCSALACPRGVSVGNVRFYDPLAEQYHPEHGNLVSSQRVYHEDGRECSDNGVCDRRSGKCQCAPGFEGAACDRMTCPRGGASMEQLCSGRGRCLSMKYLARAADAFPLTASDIGTLYGRVLTNGSNAWDRDFGRQCVCDSSWPVGLGEGQRQLAEFFGPACEFRRCPSGDDPSTRSNNETDCQGRNQYLELSGTSSKGAAELGASGNLCHVDCSNRGTCNHRTGICTCYSGYAGHNCALKK